MADRAPAGSGGGSSSGSGGEEGVAALARAEAQPKEAGDVVAVGSTSAEGKEKGDDGGGPAAAAVRSIAWCRRSRGFAFSFAVGER